MGCHQRRGDGETRTLADHRVQFDRLTEKPAQAINNCQSKAKPPKLIVVRIAQAIELAKNILALILWNSGSSIPHLDAQLFAAFPAPDDDTAVRRIAHRVRNEIDQYSLQHDEIAAHPAVIRNNPQR